jgi:hypothetical protein
VRTAARGAPAAARPEVAWAKAPAAPHRINARSQLATQADFHPAMAEPRRTRQRGHGLAADAGRGPAASTFFLAKADTGVTPPAHTATSANSGEPKSAP